MLSCSESLAARNGLRAIQRFDWSVGSTSLEPPRFNSRFEPLDVRSLLRVQVRELFAESYSSQQVSQSRPKPGEPGCGRPVCPPCPARLSLGRAVARQVATAATRVRRCDLVHSESCQSHAATFSRGTLRCRPDTSASALPAARAMSQPPRAGNHGLRQGSADPQQNSAGSQTGSAQKRKHDCSLPPGTNTGDLTYLVSY